MTAGRSVMLKVAPWRDEKNNGGVNLGVGVREISAQDVVQSLFSPLFLGCYTQPNNRCDIFHYSDSAVHQHKCAKKKPVAFG